MLNLGGNKLKLALGVLGLLGGAVSLISDRLREKQEEEKMEQYFNKMYDAKVAEIKTAEFTDINEEEIEETA